MKKSLYLVKIGFIGLLAAGCAQLLGPANPSGGELDAPGIDRNLIAKKASVELEPKDGADGYEYRLFEVGRDGLEIKVGMIGTFGVLTFEIDSIRNDEVTLSPGGAGGEPNHPVAVSFEVEVLNSQTDTVAIRDKHTSKKAGFMSGEIDVAGQGTEACQNLPATLTHLPEECVITIRFVNLRYLNNEGIEVPFGAFHKMVVNFFLYTNFNANHISSPNNTVQPIIE